jgi:arylsulfatase A-like enzyme
MRAAVLIVNGLQPAYLGAYGCEWVPTPTIDQWAANGVVFDNHFSDRPLLPLSGRMTETLAALPAAGVRTACVGPGDGDSGAWDIWLTTKRDSGPIELKSTRRAVRQAIENLGDVPDALLWIEIDALIPPWNVPDELLADFFRTDSDADEDEHETDSEETAALEPWTGEPPDRIDADDDESIRRLQHTYAAAVVSLDSALARLRKDCDKLGWGDAVWLLSSNAGFPLGEHAAVGLAGAGLHEELVHLPLLLAWPNGEQAGLRVAELTQPSDVLATLAELFGHPAGAVGLGPLARGKGGAIRTHAPCVMNSPRISTWSVRTREWYLLATDAPQVTRRLYVKPDDRWEFNDVAQHHAETVAELEKMYRDASH